VPIRAKIERQALILLASIARNGGIEKELALRQLSTKKESSRSWFVQVDHILSKYNLRSAIQLIIDPPTADVWKAEIDGAIWEFWHSKWCASAVNKSSLRYMNTNVCERKPHHMWDTVPPSQSEIKAACVKAKLLTGTYTLQSNRSRFNQYEVDATCTLCHKEPETREHFLIRCESLTDVRSKYMNMLENTITLHYSTQTWDDVSQSDGMLLQCILDCTLCDILCPIPSGNILTQIESISRWLCAALHKSRTLSLLPQVNMNVTI
jgi:hypothetical protein